MAELTTPTLATQLAAIAQLRWQIFRNTVRRKSGLGNLLAIVVLMPVLLAILFAPTIGATAASFFLVQSGHPEHLDWILWAAFALTQLFNLNLGQPGTTFQPTELLRFPISIGNYVAARLFFGLVSPGNLMICLASGGIAAGAIAAQPALWPVVLPSLLLFAIVNLLFTRMLFTWVDRWLSTRRAREALTALVFVFSLGLQWINASLTAPDRHHPHRSAPVEQFSHLRHLAARTSPFLNWTPPGLTARAIAAGARQHPAAALTPLAANAAFGLLFYLIFAARIRTEYRGESLSDAANATPLPSKTPKFTGQLHLGDGSPHTALPSVIHAVFAKEFLTLRRNLGLFYGLIAPVVFIFLFAGRLAQRGSSPWILPIAAAYSLLGVAPTTFNSFGLEGSGAQFYFFAPIPLRQVFLGKNLLAWMLAAIELVAVIGILCYVATPPTPLSLFFVLLWSIGTILLITTVGNFLSIRAPKRVDLTKPTSKQGSPLTALLSMAILLLLAALAAGALLADQFFHLYWLPLTTALTIAVGGIATYILTLPTLERFALNHRESLFEELGKKA